MDSFVRSIKKKYKERRIISEKQWPRRHSNKLVRLQLVESEKGSVNLQRGRDKQSVKKTEIKCKALFPPLHETPVVRKVLVEGDAGIGKTTLCTSISEDWADEALFQQFQLVLLLPLRDKRVASAGTIRELLKMLHGSQATRTAIADALEETEGENVLIIADGWDELSKDERNEGSFLFDLLFGSLLPLVSVLLTSRPSASASLRDSEHIDRLVEVVGFNKENIREYIESEFIASDMEKCSHLLEQLDSNPLIESICSIPLNCAIVCALSLAHKHTDLPGTMTELYTKIILHSLFRNITKLNLPKYSSIKSLSRLNMLPSDLQTKFWKLCEFAFKAIEEDQIVFSEEQLKACLPVGLESVDELLCFGLLQCVQSILADGDVTGYGDSFHFLHLTFQEYLAAYHLARQCSDRQLEVVKSHARSPRFRMVWRFFFGICCTNVQLDRSAQLSKELVASFVQNNDDKLLLCHCSLESGSNSEVTVQVVQAQLLQYGQCVVNPQTAFDCAAVVSVISNTQSCDYMEIPFESTSLGDKGMASLIQVLASNLRLQVMKLNLQSNKLTDKSIKDLFTRAAASFKSLASLNLTFNPLGASGIKALEDSVRAGTLANLKNIRLVGSLTSDEHVNASLLAPFLDALSTNCHHLDCLYLCNNNLGVPGARCVGEALPQLIDHKYYSRSELDLSFTMLGDKGMCAFIQNSQATSYPEFNILYLQGNNIHSVGVSSLADGISSGMLRVTTLYLNGNPLGLDGVVAVGIMLSSSNCQLKKLSMSNCQLTTRSVDHNTDTVSKSNLTTSSTSHDGKLTITDVRLQLCQIPQNNRLTCLVVDSNNFSGDNIEVLAGLMSLCSNLQDLSSKQCNITSECLEHLFQQFHTTSLPLPKLVFWHLNENNISDNEASVLIKYLRLSPRIEHIDLNGNPGDEHMTKRVNIALKRLIQKRYASRVVRGRGWKSGDEDGGDGHVGTVVESGEPSNDGRRVVVQWDCGNRGSYCCGVDGKFELRVLDNPNQQHHQCQCDYCVAAPIVGSRWTCAECFNYDLCTECYMAGKVAYDDLLEHEFVRHDFYLDGYIQVHVPPRAGARRVEAKGIFPGAEVVRGPDWDRGEDDGKDGEIGIVNSLHREYRSLTVEVKWISSDKPVTTTHRLALEGKVELKCVTAASGGYYYPDYLPMLGATTTVQQEYLDMISHSQQVDDDKETSADYQDEIQHCDDEDDEIVRLSDDSESYYSASDGEDEITSHHGSQPSNMEESSNQTESSDHSQLCTPSVSTLQDKLCIDDLAEVCSTIWEARVKWYGIGLELGLKDSSLQVINADNTNCDDRFTAMLRHWLQRVDPKPTWTCLIEALKSPPVDQPLLAEEIEKYQGCKQLRKCGGARKNYMHAKCAKF